MFEGVKKKKDGKKLAEINFVSHKRAPQYSYTYPFREFAGSSVKNLPAVQEEDPLDKEMATLSSILAWKISWTEEPG